MEHHDKVNGTLAKVLCHNVCVLIQMTHELRVGPNSLCTDRSCTENCLGLGFIMQSPLYPT